MNAVMPNFMTMTADGAVLLHKKMLVATEDMGEIVSAKRMLEDEDAPRAPEIPVIEEDPKTAAAFEALVARLEAGSQGERSDDGDVSSSWVPIDLTMAVRVEDVEPPSLLGRSDGRCLLYPGRTHAFQGESETLKSWAAQLATVQVVRAGKNVLYIDYEDDERGVVSRLMAMGLEPHQILEHLTYIRPDEPLRTKNDELTVGGNDFCDVLESRAFALAIIDGLTEAMTTEGLDLNSNSDVATWMRRVPRRVAKTGAAVVAIDHLPKARNNQGRYALGGQHKLAGLTGAAYKFSIRRYLSRAIGSQPGEGRVLITVEKDRPGYVRGWSLGDDHKVGELVVTSYADGGVTAGIDHVTKGAITNTDLIARIIDHLTVYDGSSQTKILEVVGGNTVEVRDTLRMMAGPESGLIEVRKHGQTYQHWLTDAGRSWSR
ncbi:MAG: AAA family ATPase [Acidimicrobiales bacterium]